MIKMRWQLAAGSILVAALMSGAFFFKQPGITFDRLPDAKAKLIAAGFLCIADSVHGQTGTGFLISREPVSWGDAGALCKAGPMGPEWKGKVWVTQNPRNYHLETIPDQADTRVWGDIVAFGDAELLSEIDEAFVSLPMPTH